MTGLSQNCRKHNVSNIEPIDQIKKFILREFVTVICKLPGSEHNYQVVETGKDLSIFTFGPILFLKYHANPVCGSFP